MSVLLSHPELRDEREDTSYETAPDVFPLVTCPDNLPTGNTTKKSKKRKNQRQPSSSTIEEANDNTENIDCGQGKHESEGKR